MIKYAAVWGTALMCVSPFFIDQPEGKIGAMLGLALLTLQAVDLRAYNLVMLNTVGILGYSFSLLGA